MYQIRKEFKFEYAHQLTSSFSKPCQTLHGHSAVIEVFFRSTELLEDSMVVDFGKIKSFIKEDIIDNFDHSLILHNIMDEEYIEMLKKYNSNVIMVPYNPTAEEMAKDICQQVRAKLDLYWDKSSKVDISVKFHETATGWAEYSEA